jgi:mono/diheme cytochrome c family protein
MSLTLIKTIIGCALLLAGLAAAGSMLTLLGKAEKKISPEKLRAVHHFFGRAFILLFLANAVLGLVLVARKGDSLPLRSVFHLVFGLGLAVLLTFKLSISRVFKQFLRWMPGLGLTVFALAFLAFSLSAGYYCLGALTGPAPAGGAVSQTTAGPDESVSRGRALFHRQCDVCHFSDSTAAKTGPGLQGVLKNPVLPASGRTATPDNILLQLQHPFRSMPPYPSLSEQDRADLIAYLRTI